MATMQAARHPETPTTRKASMAEGEASLEQGTNLELILRQPTRCKLPQPTLSPLQVATGCRLQSACEIGICATCVYVYMCNMCGDKKKQTQTKLVIVIVFIRRIGD
jgi:hypothetical protein